jgi:hypothetical protein
MRKAQDRSSTRTDLTWVKGASKAIRAVMILVTSHVDRALISRIGCKRIAEPLLTRAVDPRAELPVTAWRSYQAPRAQPTARLGPYCVTRRRTEAYMWWWYEVARNTAGLVL